MSKLLFIDPDSIRSTLIAGGQGRITWNIASRLAKRGHKVTLLTSKYPQYKDENIDGVDYIHIGISTKHIGLNFLSFIITLPFFLIFRRDDIAFECLSAPITTLLSPLFFRGKVVAITAMVEAKTFGKKYHLPLELWEKIGMQIYKHVIAYSNHYKEKIKSLNKNCHVDVIPPGIPKEFLNTEVNSNLKKNIGIFIGRIDIFQKGLDLIIESLKNDHDNKIKIIVAGFGKPSEEEALKKMIAQNQLQDKINYVGRIENEEKILLLQTASFGLVPSRFETFCVSALEFLSLGKKVVIFDIDGLKWIPDNYCERVKSFDTLALYVAMKKLSEQETTQNEIRETRLFAQEFEWENIIDRYENLINRLNS